MWKIYNFTLNLFKRESDLVKGEAEDVDKERELDKAMRKGTSNKIGIVKRR